MNEDSKSRNCGPSGPTYGLGAEAIAAFRAALDRASDSVPNGVDIPDVTIDSRTAELLNREIGRLSDRSRS